MGLFDAIEAEQHMQAVYEYFLYLEGHRDAPDADGCFGHIDFHLQKVREIIDKMKNSS